MVVGGHRGNSIGARGAFNRSAEISTSEEEGDDDMAMMDDMAERNDVEYSRGLEGEGSCADNINEENTESGNRAFINPDGSKENTISQDKASSKVKVVDDHLKISK
ncbi:hypothetical protein SLA2020_123980 [Shorea laevis]